MSKVYLGIDAGFAQRVEEVRNERKGITILFGDAIETTEVDAEAE
jgi:hypothetical protein